VTLPVELRGFLAAREIKKTCDMEFHLAKDLEREGACCQDRASPTEAAAGEDPETLHTVCVIVAARRPEKLISKPPHSRRPSGSVPAIFSAAGPSALWSLWRSPMAVEAAVSIEQEAAAARVVFCGILGKIKWSSWRHVAEMESRDEGLTNWGRVDCSLCRWWTDIMIS
jgi:hypothetical protein